MIYQVYNAKILEFAGNISRIGELKNAGATVTVYSKLCGSKITVWLSLVDGKVSDFSHDVKACALGQATSAIMAEHVIGSTTIELRQLRNDMSDMLRDSGTPPVGRFEDLKYLEPVKDYRARHASTMLTFDAVVKAIDQIEKAGEDAVSI
jgi:NifU-like protein involved in Fe-S cluster formation